MRGLAHSAVATTLLGLCACASAQVVTHGGQLALRCEDPEAEVTVDGVLRGKAGDFDGRKGRLLLSPGRHRIEVRGSSGLLAVRELTLGPQDDVTLSLSLPAPALKD